MEKNQVAGIKLKSSTQNKATLEKCFCWGWDDWRGKKNHFVIKHTQKKSQFNSHELAYNHWIIIIIYVYMPCCAAWSMRKRKSYKLALTIQLHIFSIASSALLLLAVHNCANSSSSSWLIAFIVNNGNNQSTITHRAEDLVVVVVAAVDNETFECVRMKRNTKRFSSSCSRLKFSQSLSIFIFHSFFVSSYRFFFFLQKK